VIRAQFFAIGLTKPARAGAGLFSAIFGISHWFLCVGTMVRAGAALVTSLRSGGV
jgi:hypothetical protein